MGLLSLPGVWIVKLRLLGRRLGGVGGLMKVPEGDAGAEEFFSPLSTTGSAAVGFMRRLPNELAVLIPKFFRFLGFFAGVIGLCSSKKGAGTESESMLSVCVLRDLKSAINEGAALLEIGDSGEGPGDGSVTDDESMVEMVVVGDESEDSEATVDVLSR